VVDDNDSNLLAIKALLERPGIELFMARSGSEALRLLLAEDIALALIDIHMPQMDGFELAELMRGSPRTREIPILFITAYDAAHVHRRYGAGAADFLFKPLDPGSLERKLDAVMKLQQRKAELEEQAELLRQALKLNETFTAVLGHDLRNPLGAILAVAEMIEETTTDDSARALASRISSTALRMRRMIEQLVAMARENSGRVTLRIEPVNLVELCARAIQEIEARAPYRHARIASAGDTTGRWDADRLMQVLSNLIGNAIRHGDPEFPVAVYVDGTAAGEVRLSVHNGGAIPREALPDIFEPFKRPALDERRTANGEVGLGLGLYIARVMVEAHGGSIEIRSDVATGTTVEVRLPREERGSDDREGRLAGRQRG